MTTRRRRSTKEQSDKLDNAIIPEVTLVSTSVKVAVSQNGVMEDPDFDNLSINELFEKCKNINTGEKDGSYFLRCETLNKNKRSNKTTALEAMLLIIDVDAGIDGRDAPAPHDIHKTLKENSINHLIYRSHSHGTKGNRYRILFITNRTYQRDELKPTVESALELYGGEISNVSENCTWSQPWYLPRKPKGDTSDFTYYEYTEGKALPVVDAISEPTPQWNNYKVKVADNLTGGQISPIKAFNEQYSIEQMLSLRGDTKIGDRWFYRDSKSGIPGISIKDGKMFSFHGNDPLNDGNAHDAFDLLMLIGRCV